MAVRLMSSRRVPGIGVLALAIASMLIALLVASPVIAGEISDDEERIAKIVIQINTDPERDPALAADDEVVTIYEGDYVTFRIGLNDDQTRPQFDRVAEIRETFESERFELVEFRTEFGHACDEPSNTGGPGTLECQITLGEDGNAAVWLTMLTLPIGDAQTDENGCLATRNTIHSGHPSGSDQADVLVCPAAQRPDDRSTPPPTWPPAGASSPSASPATTVAPSASPAPAASQAGGSIPDTSTSGGSAALIVAGAVLLLSVCALAMPRRRREGHTSGQ